VKIRFIGKYAKFADLDYTEGQDSIYGSNQTKSLEQNSDFLNDSGTKTVQSKNWDKTEETNNDNITRNDIDDVNEPF